ncbi:MAG: glycosyltransferase family 2 protein [Actinomycetota bacterium]|nr:glycosyltransferase family 2 protein [Actinomycetota bacterium]
MTPVPGLAVVVVCHQSAAALGPTLRALGEQLRGGDELVVVDNASTDASVDATRAAAPDATVIETGANLGFASGCHIGVRATTAPLLLLLNPDALPAPGCLEALRACAAQRPSWGAWQALVTMAGGDLINTAGNVVHYLGFGWAGRCGEPVAIVGSAPTEVGFASGAALVVRREAWDAVGGFDERYFMYGEDLDLSLRLRLAGWGIGVQPAARVAHEYEFAKGDYKWFYLERNRWWTLVGDYPGRLLAVLAPALLAFEVALLLAAWRGGWLRAKLRAQAAVLRLLPAMLRRRRAIQATRAIGPGEFAQHLEASLDSPFLAAAGRIPGVRALQVGYWRIARLGVG